MRMTRHSGTLLCINLITRTCYAIVFSEIRQCQRSCYTPNKLIVRLFRSVVVLLTPLRYSLFNSFHRGVSRERVYTSTPNHTHTTTQHAHKRICTRKSSYKFGKFPIDGDVVSRSFCLAMKNMSSLKSLLFYQ